MGLDMYLEGHKYFLFDHDNPKNNQEEDGFQLKGKILELGYWRKHPNLHGYIVTNFAGGVDECQEIELSEENLDQLLKAVMADELPETSGFFFGTSGPDDKAPSIEIIKRALTWLSTPEKGVIRSVIYRASW